MKFFDLLVAACDPPKEPLKITEVISFECSRRGVLDNVVSLAKADFRGSNWNAGAITQAGYATKVPVGLNTIGMLVDRLSILIVKKHIKKNEVNQSLELQIDEMIDAIEHCQKGHSSSFNKITNSSDGIITDHVVDIAMQLAFSNLLLWLAQDVLYLRGAGALGDKELRAYIDYFAKKNIIRNQLISRLSDFWHIQGSP